MPSSSSPGFDLRSAFDGIRETFNPSSSTTTAKSPDATAGRDIRAAVLLELSDQPMHGYQVIRAIEARTGGVWKPTPGAVYPTLQMLDDEGLASAAQVEERKVYSLTEAGRSAAADAAAAAATPTVAGSAEGAAPASSGRSREPQPTRAESIQAGLALTKSGVRLAQVMTQVAQSTTPQQSERAAAIVDEARRKLYAILAEG